MRLFRTCLLATLVVGLMAFAVGCAITDYAGWAKHQTSGEAKLWGSDTATRSGDPTDSGTFNYTVQYNCRDDANSGVRCGPNGGPYTITTYRNDGFSTPSKPAAFSWDGIVDRDGGDLEGRYGSPTPPPFTPTEKWHKALVAVDSASGCQFSANIKQQFRGFNPGILLCFGGPQEEVDNNNLSLESFGSLDDLMSQIWSNSLNSSFTGSVVSVEINGNTTTLVNSAVGSASHNGTRAFGGNVDVTTAGAKEVIQAILNSTTDEAPVSSLSVTFGGGMTLRLPSNMIVAFDHDVLRGLL